jgi:hypothetical protein
MAAVIRGSFSPLIVNPPSWACIHPALTQAFCGILSAVTVIRPSSFPFPIMPPYTFVIGAAPSDADSSDYLAELYEEGNIIQADPAMAHKWREHAEKLRGLEDQDLPSKPRFRLTGRKSRRERLMEKRSHQVKGDELLP